MRVVVLVLGIQNTSTMISFLALPLLMLSVIDRMDKYRHLLFNSNKISFRSKKKRTCTCHAMAMALTTKSILNYGGQAADAIFPIQVCQV
jgi:hypothetical protein